LVSNDHARQVLGWKPAVSFDKGLRQLIAWHLDRSKVAVSV
jgi:nucleoside-diphosphate-sugar epimerase